MCSRDFTQEFVHVVLLVEVAAESNVECYPVLTNVAQGVLG